MWYWRPGYKWHLGKGDGTYTSVCGLDLLGAPQARESMAQVQACVHCWRRYSWLHVRARASSAGLDKGKKRFATTHI